MHVAGRVRPEWGDVTLKSLCSVCNSFNRMWEMTKKLSSTCLGLTVGVVGLHPLPRGCTRPPTLHRRMALLKA